MIWCPDAAGIYAASSILLFISALAVVLRLKARRMRKLYFGWDDATIIFALIFVWGLGLINIIGAARGTLGTHTPQDPVTGKEIFTSQETEVSKISFIAQVFVVIADGFIKCSLMLMYRRIFIGKIFNWVSMALLITIIAWGVGFFFATLFSCGNNPAYNWYSQESNHIHCHAISPTWLGHAVSDVATDLMVILTPLPIIARLNMEMRSKIALIAIFSLGLVSIGAGTTRLVYVATDQYETAKGARDLRAVKTNIMLWGFVEAAVGILTTCMVTLKPLLNGRTPESLVASVRSMVSLQSCANCVNNADDLSENEVLTAAKPSSIHSRHADPNKDTVEKVKQKTQLPLPENAFQV